MARAPTGDSAFKRFQQLAVKLVMVPKSEIKKRPPKRKSPSPKVS